MSRGASVRNVLPEGGDLAEVVHSDVCDNRSQRSGCSCIDLMRVRRGVVVLLRLSCAAVSADALSLLRLGPFEPAPNPHFCIPKSTKLDVRRVKLLCCYASDKLQPHREKLRLGLEITKRRSNGRVDTDPQKRRIPTMWLPKSMRRRPPDENRALLRML
jgi:hypothetical protein